MISLFIEPTFAFIQFLAPVAGWLKAGAAIASIGSGIASFVQGRKAAKSQEEIGQYNALANLSNGRIEAERTRFNAVSDRFNAQFEAENLSVNRVILKHNQKVAKLQGSAQANEIFLQGARIGREAAQEEADLSKEQLDIARQRRRTQSQIQRDLDDLVDQSTRASAAIKAQLATSGVALTSGIQEALEDQVAREVEKAVIAINDERTIQSLANSRALEQNKKAIVRLRTTADEDSALTKLNADIVGATFDAQDAVYELEAARLVSQEDYMNWFADFTTESAELEAQVLETGAEIRATNTRQTAASQASALRGQGLVGGIQGIGQGINILSSIET